MNINRFILPASMAAALHAALLLALPKIDLPTLIAVATAPVPPKTPPVTLEPPDEHPADDPDDLPVVRVRRGTEVPETPDRPAVAPIDALTVEIRPEQSRPSVETLPGTPGLPEGDSFEYGNDRSPQIFRPADLDRVPRTTAQLPPGYPSAMRAAGIGGEVLVEFTVDASGRVLGARVVRSSRAEFDEPTLRAVLKWRFEPGRRDGRPVPFRMAIPVRFSLDAT